MSRLEFECQVDQYLAHVRKRLMTGYDRWADAACATPLSDLCREVSEECLDVVGWSFFIWQRFNQNKEN